MVENPKDSPWPIAGALQLTKNLRLEKKNRRSKNFAKNQRSPMVEQLLSETPKRRAGRSRLRQERTKRAEGVL